MTYIRNRACACTRCRACGLWWPAMLVLFGVLVLLHNFNLAHMDKTWPLLLIVAGALWVLQSSASIAGHVEPAPPAAPAPPLTQPPPASGDDTQVHHG
ncbi:MAG TPA: DUF5668 domain-containing protein [Terriglobales bacterium]|nr:DUF5668 domain-containing protein [Terriglobales bacterium]